VHQNNEGRQCGRLSRDPIRTLYSPTKAAPQSVRRTARNDFFTVFGGTNTTAPLSSVVSVDTAWFWVIFPMIILGYTDSPGAVQSLAESHVECKNGEIVALRNAYHLYRTVKQAICVEILAKKFLFGGRSLYLQRLVKRAMIGGGKPYGQTIQPEEEDARLSRNKAIARRIITGHVATIASKRIHFDGKEIDERSWIGGDWLMFSNTSPFTYSGHNLLQQNVGGAPRQADFAPPNLDRQISSPVVETDGMGLWEIGILLYLMTAIAALAMTHLEQRSSARGNRVLQVAGYAACTVWPLVIMLFVVLRTRMARA
jgi:hypothetical protein